MTVDPYVGCNLQIPYYNCTLETCCLAQSNFLYRPSYGGNLFFAVFFGVFIIPHIGLGIWYKTWGFAVGMVVGLALELVGYISRIQIHDNPFANNPFLIYLVCLTIAPVFITAAIYLCTSRIIVLHGAHLSRFKPRTIAIAFMFSDFLSLLLQAIGGAIADTAAKNQNALARAGIDVMIAGLFFQAVSLFTFLVFFADFSWRCRNGVLDMDPEKQRIRRSALFKIFRAGVLLATLAILIRSIFRVAELWQGFTGNLWNDETDFLVLDGTMMAIATLCLTATHPGLAFGGQWQAADWNFRGRKNVSNDEVPMKEGEVGSRGSS